MLLERYTRWVVRRPYWVLLGVTAVTAWLATGIGKLVADFNIEHVLPADHPFIQIDRTIRAEFGGRNTVMVGIVPRQGDGSLTHSGYNERRTACEQAVRELAAFQPRITSLRDVATTELAAYSPYLSEIPRKRAEHVVKEIARVSSAVSALHRGDRQALGALMYAGHTSLRNLYEVSTPELDTLVELTRHLPGCIGARPTRRRFRRLHHQPGRNRPGAKLHHPVTRRLPERHRPAGAGLTVPRQPGRPHPVDAKPPALEKTLPAV